MKHPRIATVLVTIVLAGASTSIAQTQGETKATTKEIMALKLEYAHYILNGVVTENFHLVEANAEKLSKLSQAEAWRASQSTEYQVLSGEFRKQADALAKAAKERNPDAASIAYVQMSLSCINCHKYMRGGKKAGEL